jgi:UDP-3-O-[3-hydroxymyristoyl] glucosamine N-acyltransferase
MTATIKLGQLAEFLGATLSGDAEKEITGLATLQEAGPAQLSFLANPQYRKYLADSRAAAVLLKAADAEGFVGDALVVADPYLAYARISHLFDPKPKAVAGIHPTAVVAVDAVVDPAASIGAFAVIESAARIAAGVTVGAHCFVGARSEIGEGGWLAPRVTLYHDVRIGKRVVIQSGAVLGGEGFGFANEKGVWQKIAQVGGVLVGDDVEIGVNTAVDRGALADTVIGNGVKLDNQIQIAHNVQIGDHTAMAV